ncbi:hypothetical protein BDV34DRAFT_3118 [Aspergillus parasiticus]|uniref:Uncharacterized protein n=1 Tax=Aspergillus parasiticus TaxID=5067 RepID=A0A5N6E486_ASPPA|nr:hypothetical protein BDV34DRAFT_3118 [Aspergillus parasiticus]
MYRIEMKNRHYRQLRNYRDTALFAAVVAHHLLNPPMAVVMARLHQGESTNTRIRSMHICWNCCKAGGNEAYPLGPEERWI